MGKKQKKQNKQSKKKEEKEEKEKSVFRLILLALSVCGALLAYGRFMEIITRSEYGTEKERFKTTTVIIFIQSITCTTTAAIILLARGASLTAGVPLTEWLIVAVSYFGAHEFGTRAFRYLTFPVQTVFKACKSVPVMIGERIFAKKIHKPSKFIGIALLLIGIIIFSLNNPAKASKMKSAMFVWNNDTIFGLIMISLALSCDGIYSPYQNKIMKDCEKSGKQLYPHHLMFNMNVWQTIFATILCLYSGQFTEAWGFVQRHPEMRWNLFYFALIAVFSNLCIYQLQREYGALTVSLTTTCRKFLGILLSVYLNGFTVNQLQWVGIAFVISSGIVSKILARFFPQLDGKKLKTQ